MSYSRWSNSKWYTYMNPRLEFVICGVITFKVTEIKYDIDKCINLVKQKTDATDKELKELRKYMITYLYDYEGEKMESFSP